MPRQARIAPGGMIYHVINRANGRLKLFKKPEDFLAFYRVLHLARQRAQVDLLAWCVMSNHWHFVVRPKGERDLSRFFGYLSLTHATRWQVAHDAVGTGHVYQGRFKSFIIQEDAHLLQVMRYVERNPLRANLVMRAEDWPWSSLRVRMNPAETERELLDESPVELGRNWPAQVNRAQTANEEQAIAQSIQRDRPLGDEDWVQTMVRKHGLQSTIRPRGRQKGWRKVKESN